MNVTEEEQVCSTVASLHLDLEEVNAREDGMSSSVERHRPQCKAALGG